MSAGACSVITLKCISVVCVYVLLVYKYGIQICCARDCSVFLTACCVNDYDRARFIADVREAVLEVRQRATLCRTLFQNKCCVTFGSLNVSVANMFVCRKLAGKRS